MPISCSMACAVRGCRKGSRRRPKEGPMHELVRRALVAAAMTAATVASAQAAPTSPAAEVNPLIGSRNGGNTFPGASLPFGMLQWSPETTKGQHDRTAAPGGYQYDATRIRGFSLTHLSGTGCAGASGDIPFMPITIPVTSSPPLDANDGRYASDFSHADEHAAPGDYRVRLANGVEAELSAALRSGIGRFTFPSGKSANLLVRVSDSEVGSSDASVKIDRAARTITGAVTSGNFCGYLAKADRRSYYTLYFVAQFDQPFTASGTWHDGTVHAHGTSAHGGTGYGDKRFLPAGTGSGGWVGFDAGATVNVRVGISYVSRSEERRVGKECRSRWSADDEKKKE